MIREYLSTAEFAELVGVSRQASHKALKRALLGHAWGGLFLDVRESPSAAGGGRSGVRYEVALSSLSMDLQDRFWGVDTTATIAVVSADNIPAVLDMAPRPMPKASQGDRIARLLDAISPILELPYGSGARSAAIRRAVRPGLSERTLRRFVAEYEAGDYDLTILARRRPSNAGKRRVHVSRSFDRAYLAAGHDADQLSHWGERRDQLLNDWWASPTQRAGWKRVRLEVQTSLWRELTDAGVHMPRKAIDISQRAVMAAQHFREVDEYAHNRKAWDDGKTRIRRDNSQWRPMQEVVLDVKHLDNIVTRPDGSTVHPKMIAFMDSGTKRIFPFFVFPTKEERGVRQEHVIRAFLAMVGDPEWGLPERIYMDNGSENLRLTVVQTLLDMVTSSGLKTIVKAKPYSGASKPIESRFSELDRQISSQMLGYVGGDRMKPHRPELNRKTSPYPHGYAEFEAEYRIRLLDFEDQPIGSGPFAGRSPREIFLASDHRPVTIDPLALDAHFATYMERTVDRGAVSIEGTRYRHPELPNGRKVTVALSYRSEAAPLVKLPGGDWAYVEAEQYYAPGLHDGAIAAGRAQANDRRRVRGLRKSATTTDVAGNMQARIGDRVIALPTAAAPAPIMDVIASSQAEELGAVWRDEERARRTQPDPEAPARARAARRMAVTEELERYFAARNA